MPPVQEGCAFRLSSNYAVCVYSSEHPALAGDGQNAFVLFIEDLKANHKTDEPTTKISPRFCIWNECVKANKFPAFPSQHRGKGNWFVQKIGNSEKSSSLSNYWQKLASNCTDTVFQTLQYLDKPKMSWCKLCQSVFKLLLVLLNLMSLLSLIQKSLSRENKNFVHGCIKRSNMAGDA